MHSSCLLLGDASPSFAAVDRSRLRSCWFVTSDRCAVPLVLVPRSTRNAMHAPQRAQCRCCHAAAPLQLRGNMTSAPHRSESGAHIRVLKALSAEPSCPHRSEVDGGLRLGEPPQGRPRQGRRLWRGPTSAWRRWDGSCPPSPPASIPSPPGGATFPCLHPSSAAQC